MFQFHIGSIKAYRSAQVRAIEKAFQFHIGSIKAANPAHSVTGFCIVSIPHWFDQGRKNGTAMKSLNIVSIPHWFDQGSNFCWC